MLTSSSRRALYTGVTNSLIRRICEHREDRRGFAGKYKAFRLVHYEEFVDVHNAIAREKEIKGWTRDKKNILIRLNNPSWRDLASDIGLSEWPPRNAC
jgi:putative endonuclease